MPLLLDTGVIYALADEDDAWHSRVRAFLEKERQVLLVPVTVLPEAAYLVRERLGPRAELELAKSVATGELAIEPLLPSDLKRIAELLSASPFLGFVDSSIVAVAERLKLTSIVTTDRRDFARVRPKHVKRFELLP
jgi:predicted nucleic acid-binding protein